MFASAGTLIALQSGTNLHHLNNRLPCADDHKIRKFTPKKFS
jgi:hypothetical protein